MNIRRIFTAALASFTLVLLISGCKKDKGSVNPSTPHTWKDTLCNYGPWQGLKLEFQINGVWEESEIPDCKKDNLFTFYQSPDQKMVYDNGPIKCDSTELRLFEGPWTLNGSTLQVVTYSTIVKLNQDTLVWVYDIGVNVRETFIHPSK